ncbi:hypothetical protein [Nesterenkonia sp. HG001]|uniref:hypothetical protein n=1 Tax=Nesterenkonia sp. HG001 TaxID=2983207 RepID=UPI002AC645AA|nr:hypothetical protein [Nesterenkonia sp. HG001]MDZ5076037.1 hypothetical protein [Nesterenkonia sp. HG001]
MPSTDTRPSTRRLRTSGAAGKLLAPLRRRLGPVEAEDGSSIVEFILLAVLLLIPIIYFMLGVSSVQGASYAASGAADQAAKMYVAAEGGEPRADSRSEAAVLAALQDFDIAADRATVSRGCPQGDCTADGDLVTFSVEIQVPVPLVPDVGSWQPTLVTVSSTSVQVQGG